MMKQNKTSSNETAGQPEADPPEAGSPNAHPPPEAPEAEQTAGAANLDPESDTSEAGTGELRVREPNPQPGPAVSPSRGARTGEPGRSQAGHNHSSRRGLGVSGNGCLLPGSSSNCARFWRLLSEASDPICSVPGARWDEQLYDEASSGGAAKCYVQCGRFVVGMEEFDAGWFWISSSEAGQMDPQQRKLLEVCYAALVDAGLAKSKLLGSAAGVFVGIQVGEYGSLPHRGQPSSYSATGASAAIAANRVSYLLGLEGPSMSVDTACSSAAASCNDPVLSSTKDEQPAIEAIGIRIQRSSALAGVGKSRVPAPDASHEPSLGQADHVIRVASTWSNQGHFSKHTPGSSVDQATRATNSTDPGTFVDQARSSTGSQEAAADAEFHGTYAQELIYWYHAEMQAWLTWSGARWTGWDIRARTAVTLDGAWIPWTQLSDFSRAPYFQWFKGGLTNCSFNEIDRHVFEDRFGAVSGTSISGSNIHLVLRQQSNGHVTELDSEPALKQLHPLDDVSLKAVNPLRCSSTHTVPHHLKQSTALLNAQLWNMHQKVLQSPRKSRASSLNETNRLETRLRKSQDKRTKPMLTKPGYSTIPPINKLKTMTAAELSQVSTVARSNFGKIEWEDAVDLRGANIDRDVVFERAAVEVYPVGAPPCGELLNRPCVITLFGISASLNKEIYPLITAGAAECVEYNEKSRAIQFRVAHFSRYGMKAALPPPVVGIDSDMLLTYSSAELAEWAEQGRWIGCPVASDLLADAILDLCIDGEQLVQDYTGVVAKLSQELGVDQDYTGVVAKLSQELAVVKENSSNTPGDSRSIVVSRDIIHEGYKDSQSGDHSCTLSSEIDTEEAASQPGDHGSTHSSKSDTDSAASLHSVETAGACSPCSLLRTSGEQPGTTSFTQPRRSDHHSMIHKFVEQQLLQISGEPIPDDENMFEVGLTSSEGTQLVGQCSKRFGVEILVTDLFGNPSRAAFSAWLAAKLDSSAYWQIPQVQQDEDDHKKQASQTVDAATSLRTESLKQITPVPEEREGLCTIVDQLRQWCDVQPDKTLYTWLDSTGNEQTSWTYIELEQRANAVCHALLHEWGCQPGERVVLMYMPGLDFIGAFWGCLFAGVIAVPVYPVDLRGDAFEKSVERFGRIVASCQAKLVLSHGEYLGKKRLHGLKQMFGGSGLWPEGLEFEATDELQPWTGCGTDYQPRPEEVAFLQFTSGSTGDPKGVMLSHGNIAHNVQTISETFNLQSEDIAVSWLPQYHDMGLIGYFILPATIGGKTVSMSPMTFLHKPGVWLSTISLHNATYFSAPNFAYQRCVDKVQDIVRGHQMDSLALDQLKGAMNAAEPIRPSTLQAFSQSYSGAGFRPEQWACAYGLAENVIYVSGFSHEPVVLAVQRDALEEGLVVPGEALSDACAELVGCGKPTLGSGISVKIVDAQMCAEAAPDRVGEIWVSGPSKALGYWGKPELSQQTFRATILDDPTGTEYLRTGDLGFIHEGELYVCSRLKDLIIVRGKNYYPQDIERDAEAAHSNLRPGCSSAFGVMCNGEEETVLVAEVRDSDAVSDVWEEIAAICNAVETAHSLQLHAVVLLLPKTIAKTTSGKIRRKQCKQDYVAWMACGSPTLEDSGASCLRCCSGNSELNPLQVVAYRQFEVNVNEAALAHIALRHDILTAPRAAKPPLVLQVILESVKELMPDVDLSENDLLPITGADSRKLVALRHKLEGSFGIEIPIKIMLTQDLTPLSLTDELLELISQAGHTDSKAIGLRLDTGASADDYKVHIDDITLQVAQRHSTCSTVMVALLQVLGVFSLLPIYAIAFLPSWLLLGLAAEHPGNAEALFMVLVVVVMLPVSLMVVVVLLRRQVSVVPSGSYPLWSWPFLRWWYGQLLFRTTHAVVGPLLKDSVFMHWWLQLLGAQIGYGARISISAGSCFELLSVGDETSLGSSVYCHEVWHCLLHIRPVVVGSRCSNGAGSAILPGAVLEDDAHLMPLSSVCCATLPAGKWVGTPPQPHLEEREHGRFVADMPEHDSRQWLPQLRPQPHETDRLLPCVRPQPIEGVEGGRCQYILRQIYQGIGIVMLQIVIFATAIPSIYLIFYTPPNTIRSDLELLIFIFIGVLLWMTIQFIMLIPLYWLLIAGISPGLECHIDSFLVVKMWFVDLFGTSSHMILSVGYLFKIKHFYWNMLGSSASLDSVNACDFYSFNTVSLIQICPYSFVSNAYLSTSSCHGNIQRFHNVSVGQGCDVALRSCLAGSLEESSMLGSLAWLPRDHTVPSGHTALGTPVRYFRIGATSAISDVTAASSWLKQGALLFFVLFVIPCVLFASAVPGYIALWQYSSHIFLRLIVGACNRQENTPSYDSAAVNIEECTRIVADLLHGYFVSDNIGLLLERMLVFACGIWTSAYVLLIFTWLCKWTVMGRYKPFATRPAERKSEFREQIRNLKYEIVYTWTYFATHHGAVLYCPSTPFYNIWLRTLGAQVGNGTCLDTLNILDSDLIQFGESCSVNAGTYVIGHLFQYGELQFNHTTIGSSCSIGAQAQVVPGVTLLDNAKLCATSRAFNGEVLKSGITYSGVPAAKVSFRSHHTTANTRISKSR